MGNWVLPGLGDVGSYQVSGTPFVFNVGPDAGGASATATLKYVTSEVQINTTGAGCTVHFGDENDTTYALPSGLSTFRIKCKKIVVSAAANQTASRQPPSQIRRPTTEATTGNNPWHGCYRRRRRVAGLYLSMPRE